MNHGLVVGVAVAIVMAMIALYEVFLRDRNAWDLIPNADKATWIRDRRSWPVHVAYANTVSTRRAD